MPIDYGRYPPNWKSEIVPAIAERSGDKCENCDVENGATVFSVPLMIRHRGRYSVRRVWVDDQARRRMLHLACEEIKRVTVVLTVAHLDHDEENHDVPLDRLRHWCQHCHLTYDASEKMRRVMSKAEK